MNVEVLQAAGMLIEKFGFPVFVGVVFMVLIFVLLRFFTEQIKTNAASFRTAIEKKDCDFLGYAEKRDSQISQIVANHNTAFIENTHAVNRLSSSIETRINREVRKDIEEKKAARGITSNDVTLG